MEEFKKLWQEVLLEIVLPRGYLDNKIETLSDEILISKAFQYCVIMRTKEGLEDFLEYRGSITNFFVDKLTKILNIQNESNDIKNRKILEYLKSNIIDDGYVFHTTNNLSAENIMKNGFKKDETDKYTQEVIERLRELLPEGFFKTDLNYIESQSERTGFFYDRSPAHFKRYSNGPEWFKRLVQSSNFIRRDYEGAQKFVMQIMDMYNQPMEKKREVLIFLDGLWKIYAPTTPHMLLISTKDNDLRLDKEIQIVDGLTPVEQISYYLEIYFKGEDYNTTKEVSASSIIDIDISKIQKNFKNQGFGL